ncbi:MAG TPA: ATP-binding protein [Bryobacteraceae bacterium]|jgi:signal transduction histidine kinase|nr:ATP-binding protein [Bryobacteraceae bacterium]
MSLARRLSFAFGSVTCVIAIGAGITSWQFLSILHQARLLAAVDAKLLAVYRVRADVGAIRRRLADSAKRHDPVAFANLANRLKRESFTDIRDAVTDFQETGTPVPSTLVALSDVTADQFDAMHRLVEVGDWTAISLRLDNQVDGILDSVREMVDYVSSDVSEQRSRSISEIEAGQLRAQIILALTGLTALAISLILGIHTTRSIVGPLSRLRAAAHQLAEGDFHIVPAVESNNELGEVSRAFVVAAAKLQDYYLALKRSNQDLERFAYVASHDLREPLRTITAFSQLLKHQCGEAIPPKGHEYLAFVTEAAARMRQLVTGILEYSRLTSSAEPIVRSVDTQQILKSALQNLNAAIEQDHAVVTYDQLPSVAGNPLQLTQLFQNLIANAIKYRRDGIEPHIHIAARAQGTMWEFCIEDNGIGIDPKYHAQVFGMFKQLNHGEQEGVGVGLAVSKRIVEQHGGEIFVMSNVGEGCRFYFTLRAAHPAPMPPELVEPSIEVDQLQ